MNHIYFGVVNKAQGLRGEFRVKNDISVLALKNIKKILIDNTEYSLSKVIDRQTFVVLKVDELNDINQVEKLRNKSVYIESNADVDESEVLVDKFAVLDNRQIGKIVDVQNYGASDILIIQTDAKEIMCPVVDGLIDSVTDSQVNLNSKIWAEVVYED